MAEPVAYYNDNWTLTPRAYKDAIARDPSLFADMKPAFASPPVAVQEEGDAKVIELCAAMTDLLGWFPGRAVWHTDAPIQSAERARKALAAMKGDQP